MAYTSPTSLVSCVAVGCTACASGAAAAPRLRFPPGAGGTPLRQDRRVGARGWAGQVDVVVNLLNCLVDGLVEGRLLLPGAPERGHHPLGLPLDEWETLA